MNVRINVSDRLSELIAARAAECGKDVESYLVDSIREKVEEGPMWDDSAEGVAEWISWYDSLKPLILTEAELAEIKADRQSRKETESSQFDAHAVKLSKQWE